MAVQSRVNSDNTNFILSGMAYSRESETLLAVPARTAPLLKYTLMAKVAADGKWVPFTDETATDGTAIAQGIYIGDDITDETKFDTDLVGIPVIVGGSISIDSTLLVIENAKTLATVVGAATVGAHTVGDDLKRVGIFTEATVDIDLYENA